MIDLHTHILPGIDDGPKDLAGTVTMAEVAAENGIETLVATPHIREDYPRVDVPALPELVAETQDALAGYGIGVRIVPGGELAISRAVEMSDDELRAVTLGGNGRDLLVETPHGALPSLFGLVVADLQARGFRVTLAHPELSPDFQQAPERLGELVERGALVQITASSLEARWSRRGRLAKRALKAGHVHVIASDSHSASWRPPDLSAAPDGALGRWLTVDVPRAILAGETLPPRP